VQEHDGGATPSGRADPMSCIHAPRARGRALVTGNVGQYARLLELWFELSVANLKTKLDYQGEAVVSTAPHPRQFRSVHVELARSQRSVPEAERDGVAIEAMGRVSGHAVEVARWHVGASTHCVTRARRATW